MNSVEAREFLEREFASAVVLDFETTGLSAPGKDARWPHGAQPVEVAVVDVGTCGVLYQSLIRFTGPFESGARDLLSAVGFPFDALASAPTWADVRAGIAGAVRGRSVFGWNSDFDYRIRLNADSAIGLDTKGRESSPWHDLGVYYLAIQREAAPETVAGRVRYPKLTDVAQTLRLPGKTAHRAAGDCVTTAMVYRSLLGMTPLPADPPLFMPAIPRVDEAPPSTPPAAVHFAPDEVELLQAALREHAAKLTGLLPPDSGALQAYVNDARRQVERLRGRLAAMADDDAHKDQRDAIRRQVWGKEKDIDRIFGVVQDRARLAENIRDQIGLVHRIEERIRQGERV